MLLEFLGLRDEEDCRKEPEQKVPRRTRSVGSDMTLDEALGQRGINKPDNPAEGGD